MDRHYTKTDFPVIGLTVIALEILAFLIFVLGLALAVFNMMASMPIFTPIGIIILVLGVVISAFIILAFAEFLQLLLKIEVNTRGKTAVMTESVMKASPVKRRR